MFRKFFELGIRFDDLEKARKRIDKILNIEMTGVDSHAYGGDLYIHNFNNKGKLRLFQNWNAIDGEWNRSAYEEYPLLIELDLTRNMDDIEKKLTKDPVLRVEILKKEEY